MSSACTSSLKSPSNQVGGSICPISTTNWKKKLRISKGVELEIKGDSQKQLESVRVVFLGFLGQEVCRWEGSLIINKSVWYAEVSLSLSLFLRASVPWKTLVKLYSARLDTSPTTPFDRPERGPWFLIRPLITGPRVFCSRSSGQDDGGFRSCRSHRANSHVFNRFPPRRRQRGDKWCV